MNRENEMLNLLAIGLDPQSLEALKTSLEEEGIKYHLCSLQGTSELENFYKKGSEAIFFFSNRQNQKTWDDIKKIKLEMPKSPIILLSPRPDHQGIIGSFRVGVFDFLTIPLDRNEMRAVLFRLKLNEAIQSGEWTPERAVLHLFSRPENFSSVAHIVDGLKQYLNLFFKIESETVLESGRDLYASVSEKLVHSKFQNFKVKNFIKDQKEIIMGLRISKDKFHILVKCGDGKFAQFTGVNSSAYSIKNILSDYLSNIIKTALNILDESKKRDEIRMLAYTDEVTGCFNQRKLVEDLEFYISRYPHERMSFSLLFVDIDYFKTVNDRYGHIVGSQLLVDMAAILKKQLRSSDLVYRYGGDEFIALLPRTNIDETKKIALRVSESIKAAVFHLDNGEKYKLSLSVGIAEFPSDAQSAKSIIEFADKMMYESKKSGRGKVFHVTEVVA